MCLRPTTADKSDTASCAPRRALTGALALLLSFQALFGAAETLGAVVAATRSAQAARDDGAILALLAVALALGAALNLACWLGTMRLDGRPRPVTEERYILFMAVWAIGLGVHLLLLALVQAAQAALGPGWYYAFTLATVVAWYAWAASFLVFSCTAETCGGCSVAARDDLAT